MYTKLPNYHNKSPAHSDFPTIFYYFVMFLNCTMKAKIWTPYVAALFIFAAVSAIYFAPQFSGKVLQMHDVTQYRGMSQDIREHKAAYGEDPQWEGRMFGGMPAYHISFDAGAQPVRWIDNVFHYMTGPAGMIFLCMTSFWLMLLMFGVNPWVGVISSVAYGLSTYTILIIGAGHIGKVVAMGYVPVMIGAIYYTLRRNMWAGAALTALFGTLEIHAGHPQITYYFLFVAAVLWINELVRAVRKKLMPRFAKATGLLLVAGLFAVGANLSSLWYTSAYSKFTTRGGSELAAGKEQNATGLDFEYAMRWSYGLGESFNMFIPDFMGGGSGTGFSEDGSVAQSLTKYGARKLATQLPPYWGDQPGTGGPTYIGASVFFLAVLGLFLLRGRRKWWIFAVSLLALFLAWGSNMEWLSGLFFDYFPAYAKFRAPATILVILQWAVPLLGALALGKIWQGKYEHKKLMAAIGKAFAITGGVAIVFALFGGVLFDFYAPGDAHLSKVVGLPEDVLSAMRTERASMLKIDAVRSLFFVCLAAVAVWLFAAKKINKWVMTALLVLLVTIDLALVDSRFLSHDTFVEKSTDVIKPTEADMVILEDSTPGFRVANLTVSTFSDATTSYFHRSVGGYHGAKLQRYQDVIDRHLSQHNQPVYNMLNVRYFIVPDEESGRPMEMYNPAAFGPAWLVEKVTIAPGAKEAIDALTYISPDEAIVEQRFADMVKVQPMPDEDDTIYLDEYRVNYQRYVVETKNDAVAVFSEIYYPEGWKMYIDGQEHDYFAADYILRGAVIPAGKHTVEFRFAAPHFGLLSAITNICAVIILLSLALAFIGSFVRKK